MENKQNINCDVKSCKFQNNEKEVCELDEIKVSSNNNCDNDEYSDCGETICQSFKTTSSNINDNEYEVQSEMDDEDTNEKEGE